jgi:hypothetical protein
MRTGQPCTYAPPKGPRRNRNPVSPLVDAVSWRSASWYSASNGVTYAAIDAACLIAVDPIAWPIVPSKPATSPAPKSMKIAIPFAVDESKTEPSSDTAVTSATPPAISSGGVTIRSGHQCIVNPVMTTAARSTATT